MNQKSQPLSRGVFAAFCAFSLVASMALPMLGAAPSYADETNQTGVTENTSSDTSNNEAEETTDIVAPSDDSAESNIDVNAAEVTNTDTNEAPASTSVLRGTGMGDLGSLENVAGVAITSDPAITQKIPVLVLDYGSKTFVVDGTIEASGQLNGVNVPAGSQVALLALPNMSGDDTSYSQIFSLYVSGNEVTNGFGTIELTLPLSNRGGNMVFPCEAKVTTGDGATLEVTSSPSGHITFSTSDVSSIDVGVQAVLTLPDELTIISDPTTVQSIFVVSPQYVSNSNHLNYVAAPDAFSATGKLDGANVPAGSKVALAVRYYDGTGPANDLQYAVWNLELLVNDQSVTSDFGTLTVTMPLWINKGWDTNFPRKAKVVINGTTQELVSDENGLVTFTVDSLGEVTIYTGDPVSGSGEEGTGSETNTPVSLDTQSSTNGGSEKSEVSALAQTGDSPIGFAITGIVAAAFAAATFAGYRATKREQ